MDYQYEQLVLDILENGCDNPSDRTGVGTRSTFGNMLRYDLSKGFPALTTKRLAWRAVVGELLWFCRGLTDIESLREITYGEASTKRTIWDANYENQGKALGYTEGNLGPVYGAQWAKQLPKVLKDLEAQKNTGIINRRLLVSSWNVDELENMALPPCHYSFQLYLRGDTLSLCWTQRSVDVFLGLPFNIASYALLLHIIAASAGLKVGDLVFFGADTHIYLNHLDAVKEQLTREPRKFPKLVMPEAVPENDTLTNFEFLTGIYRPEDFILEGYSPHPTIKAPMAV